MYCKFLRDFLSSPVHALGAESDWTKKTLNTLFLRPVTHWPVFLDKFQLEEKVGEMAGYTNKVVMSYENI